VNAEGRPAENGHQSGVGQIRARQLHVVGLAVRRDAFEQQLAGVGVFAFVPFEGEVG